LFALSNFGSLLALVSFPFLVEPRLASRMQAYSWSTAYVVFALVCAFTAWVSKDASQNSISEAALLAEQEADAAESSPMGLNLESEVAPARKSPTQAAVPGFLQLLLWVSLSACASVLLIAVTNHMSENVAPIPLLWVLPLAIYLLTFIFCFESSRYYQRWLFIPLLFPAIGGMAYMIYAAEGNLTIKWAIPGFAAGLFICCMLCHGELARRRPAPRHLTLFYLMVSLGGAIGGVFVALIAPRIFVTYFELEIGLVACAILALVAAWNVAFPKLGPLPVRIAIVIGIGALGGYVARKETDLNKGVLLRVRNFYGPLEVRQDAPTEPYAERTLMHGTINHGSQLVDPVLKYVNTSYYGKNSGIGRAIKALQARGPVRMGLIGLGSGVTTNYGRKGDYMRVYEINPLIEMIAQKWFTFYPHSDADKKILMGDARLTLERQEPQNFDLMAVDAFSSDAIPVHLLTREAAAVYWKHLKPNGVLALHISNRYLNLEPVCLGDAIADAKLAMTVDDDGDEASYMSASTWVLLTSDADFFKGSTFTDADMHAAKPIANFRPWTDDYSNLFQILSLK
jgi:hypothetical protein